MARVTSTGNYLKKSTPGDLGGAGTVFIRFKPNGWSSGVGSPRTLFGYSNAAINTFLWYLGNGGDNNIYVGWVVAGSSSRVVIADTGIFSDGVWGNHVFDWDDTADLQHLYVDNTLKGTSSTAFTTPTGLTDLTIGTNSPKEDTSIDQHSGQGHIAEFARWDHVLDSTERSTLQSTGNPACLSTGLLHHYKILGNDSPEPDEITADDLTVVGSPTQTTHPTVGSCGSTYTLTAATGSFTETGQAANLLFGRKVSAATGSFAHTGQDASLKLDRKLIANAGTFTETGQDAGLLYGRRLGADAGAFIFTGQDATLRKGYAVSAGTGAFLLTGQDASLKAARLLSAGVGVFVLTGRAADLQYSGNLQVPGINLTVSDSAVLNLTTTDSSVLRLTVDDTLATG